MGDLLKNPADIKLLSHYVAEACCIHLGEEKGYLFEARLGTIVAQSGAKDIPDFIRLAKADTTGKLRDKIVDAMTTHETYWFRDERPWTALRNHLLPRLAQDIKSGRKPRIRILSAACSTGQEPYSLAMSIDRLSKEGKLHGVSPSLFEITGIDVSPGTLMLASNGRYNQIEIVRGLHEDWRNLYFTASPGNTWTLAAEIRQRVKFKRLNLQDDLKTLGMFDLLLCRNVAIYFEEAFKKELFRRLAEIIFPEGHLLLGGTESLLTHQHLFGQDLIGDAIFYKRKNSPPTPS